MKNINTTDISLHIAKLANQKASVVTAPSPESFSGGGGAKNHPWLNLDKTEFLRRFRLPGSVAGIVAARSALNTSLSVKKERGMTCTMSAKHFYFIIYKLFLHIFIF